MASFPSNPVKRRNRRTHGRNQGTAPGYVSTAITGTGSTITINFSKPVNVAGPIGITVATLTPVTQTVVSPTQVTILMSGALATHAWSAPTPIANVSSYEGSVVAGGSGTF